MTIFPFGKEILYLNEVLRNPGFVETGFETFLAIKLLDKSLSELDVLLDFDNWRLVMGDSDCFLMPLIMNKNIKIGNHIISENSPVFCIGELSCNHLNNYELAMKTIDAMIDAGVDCIKLQTAKPDKITLNCDSDDFIIKGGTLWDNRTLYSLYVEAQTPWEWHEPIKDYVESRGVEFCLHHLTKVRLIF